MWKSLKERMFGTKPEPFPVQFERAVYRLASDPTAPSIPVSLCLDHFGDDLLRYVPLPRFDLIRPGSKGNNNPNNHGFLDAYDWEDIKRPLSPFFQFRLARHLAEGKDYRISEIYQQRRAQIEGGTPFMPHSVLLDSTEKLDQYCEYMQWLIDSVRKNGLRSRREASHLFAQDFEQVRRGDKEILEKDIQVAVDKSGEFMRYNSGRHRLAAAHALGIQEIPAKIRVVHVGLILSLIRETEARPDIALRQWLGRFRPAAE